MACSDPTLDFLRRLDDPSQWVIVRGVPIFKEHERTDRDGKLLYKVGQAELEKAVRQYQRLAAEYGVVPRITIGHVNTDRNAPETAQPEVVGYARNLRIGQFGPAQTLAVLADCYYRKDAWERARRFPYRSAEYYPHSGEITGIALLVRDPQLDLGMVAYEREHPRYSYAMENSVMDPTTNTADVLSPEETQLAEKIMRYMCSKIPGLQQLAAAPAPAAQPPAPEQLAAAPPAPALPSNDGDKKDGHPDQNRRTVDPVRYQRLEADFRQLQQQYVRAECQRQLERLQEEGFQFDLAQEVAVMVPMTPELRTQRLGYIRQYYRQAPVAKDFIPVPVFAGQAPTSQGSRWLAQQPDEATTDKIVQYQREHDCDWEEASAAILGKK